MDEFIENEKDDSVKGMRGILSSYANPELAIKEKGAWECAAVEKYGNS